jgi:hypothetical protein
MAATLFRSCGPPFFPSPNSGERPHYKPNSCEIRFLECENGGILSLVWRVRNFFAGGFPILWLLEDSTIRGAGEKKRGAWQNHKRLPYCSINFYRTSLDHLLLGMDADIDWMSTAAIIKPFLRIAQVDFGRRVA